MPFTSSKCSLPRFACGPKMMTSIAALALLLIPVTTAHAGTGGGVPLLYSTDASSYCTLLHVPPVPLPAVRPKPFLGVVFSAVTPEQPFPGCPSGSVIRVDGVIDGTPAAMAGIRENDAIFALNGKALCGEQESVQSVFRDIIASQAIGAELKIDLVRGTKTSSVTASLAEMPTHYQTERDHRDIEKCPDDKPSLLASALRSRDALPRFVGILAGLNQISNSVHNPKTPYRGEADPLQLQEVTWLLRHPLTAGTVAKEMSRSITAPLNESDWRLGDLVGQAARLLDTVPTPPAPLGDITFPGLLRVMEATKDKVERALSSLTPAEAALLREKAISPWDDDKWNTIVELSLKIDRAKLFSAFVPLLSFLTRDNLAVLREDLIKRFGSNKGPILFEATTPLGKVIVGGPGPNVYQEDAALILDLGGDDLYLNNAGGSRPDIPVALVIDWGGNDTYIAGDNFSQGAGVLGGGFLIDLGGDDTFVALDGSQGGGFWGIGLLYHGDGNGVFQARSFSQGVGQFGAGILVNRTGDTSYGCSFGGQGLGLFGGAGILIDEGGNDLYRLGGLRPDFRDPLKSTDSYGQGFGTGIRAEKGKYGVPGGVGMLIDEAGSDKYIADYFAQGSSYYFGLGILDDREGNDHYIAGRYAQGAGIHSSVGVLIDGKGNDTYYASFGVAQGLGHDFGVGFLEDDEGENSFRGGTLVHGAATNGGLGILVDSRGGRFSCIEKGGGYAAEEDAMGIMITGVAPDTLPENRTGIVPVKIGIKSPAGKQSGAAP
jgi:hypothetical protein